MANAELAQRGAAEVRFDGVCKSYGVNRVLRGLNFTLEAGGRVLPYGAFGLGQNHAVSRAAGAGAVRCRVNNGCFFGRYFHDVPGRSAMRGALGD